MALELTVIYTRETDRVPMTASDLVAAGGQAGAAAVAVSPSASAAAAAGLGARGKRKPKPTETKGGALLILSPS